MTDPDKAVFINAYFKHLKEALEKLLKLRSLRVEGLSFRDEALILCLVYIDGLASNFYGEATEKNFCKALAELSGNPIFAKLHPKRLLDPKFKFWNSAPKAKQVIETLISNRIGELFDEAEIADIIRKSGLPSLLEQNLIEKLWQCSIGAICYEHMRFGAVHGLGTGSLSFDNTTYNGKHGVTLDFDLLYAALQNICNHVARGSTEMGEWFGRPDYFKSK
jgi:hypothetical protein